MKKIITMFIIVFAVTGCTINNNTNENDKLDTESKEAIEVIEYYKDNEMINKYINLFNESHPDIQITSDMLSVYYHHGSEHKDQVQFYFKEQQITLTGGTYSNTISIYIDNVNSENDDVVKELTILFTSALNNNLSIDKILEYWNLIKESSSSVNKYDDIEFLTNKDINTNKVNYIKISGKI